MTSSDGLGMLCELKPLVQRRDMVEQELQIKPDIARVGAEGGRVHPEVESAIQRARGGGQLLEGALQEQMGATLCHDFCEVRVHTGPEADELNRYLGARAFTVGSDIFFKRGAYDPASLPGREMIAHELIHVMQQTTGRVTGNSGRLTVRPAGDVFEQEAKVLSQLTIAAEGRERLQPGAAGQDKEGQKLIRDKVPAPGKETVSITIQRTAQTFASHATEDPELQGQAKHPYTCHMAVLYWAFRDRGDDKATAFKRVDAIAKFKCILCKGSQKGIPTHQNIPSQWFGTNIYKKSTCSRVNTRDDLQADLNVGDVLITGHDSMPNHSMVVVRKNYAGDNRQTFIRGFNNKGALNTGIMNKYDNADRNIDVEDLWSAEPGWHPPLIITELLFGHRDAIGKLALFVVSYNRFIQQVGSIYLSTKLTLGW